MARKSIITGIDIGTHHVKVLVAERTEGGLPSILGRGYAESKGLRHGYIVSPQEAAKSVRSALAAAGRAAKTDITQAYLAVGGVSVEALVSRGGAIIARGDSQVTETDVANALEAAERLIPEPYAKNRKVIHSIPLTFALDNQPIIGRPGGMRGGKLTAEVLFVTALEQHLHDLIQAVEDAGVAVLDVMASPLAASIVTLTRAQKIAGCVLVNIGAETASLVVFENNIPISLEIFPLGGSAITNDLALGFKISLEDAEEVKLGVLSHVSHSKKRVEEIVEARLADIFELIEAHLKKMGKSGLLPAGVVITGGSSGIATIEDIAKAALQIPSRVGFPSLATPRGEFKDASWAVAYGLCVWGSSNFDEESLGIKIARQTKNKLVEWLRQFLP
jgi:cell division protein FtsA